MENKEQKSAFDFAVLLTLGTGILYLISWVYWTEYYSYFGIRRNLIDLSFYQVIASTWSIFAMFFIFVLYPLFRNDGRIKSLADIETNLYNFLLIMLLPLLHIISSFNINKYISIGAVVIVWLIISIFKEKLTERDIDIGNKLKDFHGKFFFSVFVLMIAIMFNSYFANVHAENLANGVSDSHKITLKLHANDTIFKDYILVAQMNGKYFICKETKEGGSPETVIVNETDVKKASVIIPN